MGIEEFSVSKQEVHEYALLYGDGRVIRKQTKKCEGTVSYKVVKEYQSDWKKYLFLYFVLNG
jgi:hypothetical protein